MEMAAAIPLEGKLHAEFIRKASRAKGTVEYEFTEHLRMSGAYWGVAALSLLGEPFAEGAPNDGEDAFVEWVLSCQCAKTGGFAGNTGHDPHILYTLSAVQLLALFDRMDRLDDTLPSETADAAGGDTRSTPPTVSTRRDAIVRYVAGLQRQDGSFAGDEWGEIDTRFSYCALSTMSLLDRMQAIDVEGAAAYVESCKNFDGGYGCTPGGESHAGQVFTCVGALEIAGWVEKAVDVDVLGWWLCERQGKGGGLNGRPEKLEDVCYSWWVLSSLAIIRRLPWISRPGLQAFILSCQDTEDGGISDRPDDMADVYHTFFGIAGLSLMGFEGLEAVDPVYALPEKVVARVFAKYGREYTPWSSRIEDGRGR